MRGAASSCVSLGTAVLLPLKPDTDGRLAGVSRALPGATTHQYDAYGRVWKVTDSDSYTLTTEYNALDRPIKTIYPDGTFTETVYNRLDPEKHRDRMGRRSFTFHDALRRVVTTRDVAGRTVALEWGARSCSRCGGGVGQLLRLVDPNGNETRWEYDIQGSPYSGDKRKMRRRILVWIGAALLCLAVGGGTAAEDSRRQLGDLVGEYSTGPGISSLLSLTIHENGRFCYDLGSDIGVLEEGCGNLSVEGRRLSFAMADAKPSLMSREPWHVVEWGQRLYLIPESRLLDFANSVNWGFEPRAEESGSFLFRRGDSQRQAAGLPPLPERWRSLLLRRPVRGSVIRVQDGDEGEIDIGSDHGLREGMELWVTGKGSKAFMVEITAVRGRTSSVRIEFLSDGPLAVGQRVKSRP